MENLRFHPFSDLSQQIMGSINVRWNLHNASYIKEIKLGAGEESIQLSSSKKTRTVNKIRGKLAAARPSLLVQWIQQSSVSVRQKQTSCKLNRHNDYQGKKELSPSNSFFVRGDFFFFFFIKLWMNTQEMVVIVFFPFNTNSTQPDKKRYINTPQMSQQLTTKYTGYKER